MKIHTNDTIAAIATPLGVGAISVVRMSGKEAIAVAESVFRGSIRLSRAPTHTMHLGKIVNKEGEIIDEVLVALFRSPNSYTGENGVEINCHGGVFVTKKVLSCLIDAGARHADPGEFTKRAFLNGKLDLAQAEAIADLIKAGSERALKNSVAQLNGLLGEKVHAIRAELIKTCALLELQLDFADDDVQITNSKSIEEALLGCAQQIQGTLSTFDLGRKIRDGVSVAIVGRPNVGKSSIFNRLLGEDRSIVSATPGTTRDFLEESIGIEGIQTRLFDTAGLRSPSDNVEAEGISRTKRIIGASDLVLLVVDSTREETTSQDIEQIKSHSNGKATVLVARNKVDIGFRDQPYEQEPVLVSAKTGEGIQELRDRIGICLFGGRPVGDSGFCVSSGRQQDAIVRCLRHIENAIGAIRNLTPLEFVASDAKLAIDALGEVTGEVTSEDILNSIFSSFCVGK